ncbi:MAG: class I SAM-dependent methyltransferase, partial [Dehalococcoidia bacterium]
DIQQEFLAHVMRRVGDRGLAHALRTLGDATRHPYEDASVDAVVLIAVLGEIPDSDAALREVRRVLRPSGRLVGGELFGDPHFTTLGSLRRRGAEAGLAYRGHSGYRLAYFAHLTPA